MDYKFKVYHQKNSFIWLGMAIKEASLIDLMHITKKKFAYYRKNKLYRFNVFYKKDEPGRLSWLNAYCNCRVKPP